MRKKAIGIIFTSLFFLLFSCSGSPPEIQGVTWQKLITVTNGKPVSTALSIFVNVFDEDGNNDIESIYIINDNEELFWKLTPDDWSEKNIDSRLWIGSNGLLSLKGSSFPDGRYRVVVIDKGGERQVREIYLSPCSGGKPVPSLRVSGEKVTVTSDYRDNYLQLKDSGGAVLKILTVVPGVMSIDLIKNGVKGNVGLITLYSYDNTENCGYIVSVSVP